MKKIFFILLLSLIPLWSDIDAQIEAIQHAPVAERFKLMNAFKKDIVEMRETERLKAMRKLKSITQSKYANRAFKELRTLTQKTKNSSHIEDNTQKNENTLENSSDHEVEHETQNETEKETMEHIERDEHEERENEHND